MEVSLILQLIGLALDFIGAFFLTISEYKTKRDIEVEDQVIIGGNLKKKASAWRKSKVSILSICLLTIGFGFQFIGLLIGVGAY